MLAMAFELDRLARYRRSGAGIGASTVVVLGHGSAVEWPARISAGAGNWTALGCAGVVTAMSKTNTIARSLNDLGLAAWFGGSLMGAVGLNEAGARAARPTEVTAVAGQGWSAWTP